ncbi:antitoxin [Streptomyces sp. NBC_01275]|uniref:antitoxin n=1 Tax=Streptomyces sp. NBC_01275 TaxID=2903807 RepID=UPI002255276C|nr:antitoxin [Streptomyces sp. NBC_01275]MCX4762680.1 antitoxin [Streptomyces sp. NBC_01275]
MGIFDRFKSQARHKARDTSDVAEKKANEKTGNKYESQVDTAQQQMNERLGINEDRREQP